jgi:hypothetical protein
MEAHSPQAMAAVSHCLEEARAPQSSRWLLLLGDSLLRHVFMEFARTACDADSLPPHFTDKANKANYHNARALCVLGQSHQCVAALSKSHFLDPTELLIPNEAEKSCSPPGASLCIAFITSTHWQSTLMDLKSTYASHPCTRSPRAVVVNPGTHQIMESGSGVRAGQVALAMFPLLLDMAGNDTTVVFQLTTPVNTSMFKTHTGLNNEAVRNYNNITSRMVGRVRSGSPLANREPNPCVAVSDVHHFTAQLVRRGLTYTSDGIHWQGLWNGVATNETMPFACTPCSHHRSAPARSWAQFAHGFASLGPDPGAGRSAAMSRLPQ